MIMHRNGAMESDPRGDWSAALIAELEIEDEEHPDIAVTDERGWCLSAFPGGLVIWENVEDEARAEQRHTLTREGLRQAVGTLSKGNPAAVEAILAVPPEGL